MRRALLAVILGVTLASCGASDEERVETAVLERFEAAMDRDVTRFCELTSPEARRNLTTGGKSTVQACAAAEPLGDAPATARQRRAVDGMEVTGVEVDGDKATASVRVPDGGELEVQLQQDDGDWRYYQAVTPLTPAQ